MRRALLLSATLLAQPALAGDWPVEPQPQLGADWSGGYAGIFGGAGISTGRAALADFYGALIPADVAYGLFPGEIKHAKAGGLVGAAAGVNFQSGAFVGGVEADIGYAFTDVHNSYSRIDNVPGSPFPGVSTNTGYETDFGLLGTLRARGGYAFGDTLLFATAGLAAGDVRNRLSLGLPEIGYASPDWSGSGMRFGYALGIGVEHRLTGNVNLKFETIYVNLADRTVLGTDASAFPGEAIGYRFSNDIVLPRLGVSMKF